MTVDGEVDVRSLGSGQPDGSEVAGRSQADEPDTVGEAGPDELDGRIEIGRFELGRVRSNARQHDDPGGLHASTLGPAPKRETPIR